MNNGHRRESSKQRYEFDVLEYEHERVAAWLKARELELRAKSKEFVAESEGPQAKARDILDVSVPGDTVQKRHAQPFLDRVEHLLGKAEHFRKLAEDHTESKAPDTVRKQALLHVLSEMVSENWEIVGFHGIRPKLGRLAGCGLNMFVLLQRSIP